MVHLLTLYGWIFCIGSPAPGRVRQPPISIACARSLTSGTSYHKLGLRARTCPFRIHSARHSPYRWKHRRFRIFCCNLEMCPYVGPDSDCPSRALSYSFYFDWPTCYLLGLFIHLETQWGPCWHSGPASGSLGRRCGASVLAKARNRTAFANFTQLERGSDFLMIGVYPYLLERICCHLVPLAWLPLLDPWAPVGWRLRWPSSQIWIQDFAKVCLSFENRWVVELRCFLHLLFIILWFPWGASGESLARNWPRCRRHLFGSRILIGFSQRIRGSRQPPFSELSCETGLNGGYLRNSDRPPGLAPTV